MKRIVRIALYALLFATVAFLAFQLISYNRYVKSQERQVIASGQATTNAVKTELNDFLTEIEKAAQDLGTTFGERDFTKEDLEALIKQVSLDNPAVRGVTACYEKFAFSETQELYCPYYDKSSQSLIDVADSYDYTVKGSGTAWYTDVVDQGAKWANPYYGAAAQEWFVDYGVPFYYASGPKQGQVRGIIDFALEVGDFKRLIHAMTVGKTGYGFITSENGLLVAHPIADYVGTKNIRELLEGETREGLITAYEGVIDGQAGSQEFYDIEQNEASLIFYDRLPSANYGMGMVFFKRDLMDNQRVRDRRIIKLCLTFSFLFVLGLTLYFGRDILDRTEIEVISVLATLLLIANVLFIGFIQHSAIGELGETDSPPIIDTTSLGNYVGQQISRAETLKIETPAIVPTGIYVERIDFVDSYNVNMGGIIWQKYPLDIVDDVTIGIRFSQVSPFAEASYLEETYREVINGKEGEDGYLLVGWDFRMTLRLNLNYAFYPFDKRHLDVELKPMSHKDNLLLVPDLNSYDVTSPAQLAGLDPNVFMSGNQITRSYFNFTTETYDADFGYGSKTYLENVPVLHFNVHIKRLLLNAFVTYLIPIFVALSLIYILIMAVGKTEARQGIIESMAAFFFVLIFSHIDLRKDVETADVMFMEYFYFITYFLIVASTLNLMAYTKSKTSLFDFHDNQVYRAVYFPTFFLLLLIVMIIKFY